MILMVFATQLIITAAGTMSMPYTNPQKRELLTKLKIRRSTNSMSWFATKIRMLAMIDCL